MRLPDQMLLRASQVQRVGEGRPDLRRTLQRALLPVLPSLDLLDHGDDDVLHVLLRLPRVRADASHAGSLLQVLL